MIKINGAAFFAEYEKMRTLVVSENIKGDGNYDVSFNTISGIHISGYVSGSEIEGFDTVGSITVYNATINNGNEFFTITISSESIKEFTNDCELFCIEEITRYSVDTDVVSTKTPLYLINNKTGEELVARYTEAKTFGGISFDSFDKRIIVKPSGFSKSEASLAKNLFGASPTDTVSPSSSLTRFFISLPAFSMDPYRPSVPVISRKASSTLSCSTSGEISWKIAMIFLLISK